MANVELTAIGIERGNCLKIALEGKDYSLTIDNGRVPSEFELPPDIGPFPVQAFPPVDPENTVYGRLAPHFRQGENVHQFHGHPHLDHNGGFRALWYLSKELDFELNTYMSRFGAEVAAFRDFYRLSRDEAEIFNTSYYTQIGGPIRIGDDFRVIPHLVCHSTPTSHIFEIETPAGLIVWLMDFTFGRYSLQQREDTISLLESIGRKKPRLAFVESLYSSRIDQEDFTPLETEVWDCFEKILVQARIQGKRVIIAQFGSNVDRTMANLALAENSNIPARLIGAPWHYLQAAQLAEVKFSLTPTVPFYDDIPPEKSGLLVVSGCQAEPFAILSRSVNLDPPELAVKMGYSLPMQNLDLGPDDIVVLSSTPIPFNYKRIVRMIHLILDHGCQVILPSELAKRREFRFYGHSNSSNISFDATHVSGHERWYGIRTALDLLKPQYVVPYHGDHNQRSLLAWHIENELPNIQIRWMDEGDKVSIPTS